MAENNLEAEREAHPTVRAARINPIGPRSEVKIASPAKPTTGNIQYPNTDATDESVMLPALLISDWRMYMRMQEVTASP